MRIINALKAEFLKSIIFLLFTFGTLFSAYGHQDLDSLRIALLGVERPEEKIDILYTISKNLRQTDPPQALTYNQAAYDLAKLSHQDEALLSICVNFSRIYYNMGQFDNAVYFGQESKKMALQTVDEDSKVYADVLIQLADAYRRAGKGESSVLCSQEALAICQKKQDTSGIISAYTNMGIYYFDHDSIEGALNYFPKALSLAQLLGDSAQIARCYNNQAGLYEHLLLNKKALKSYWNALRINESIHQYYRMGLNYTNLGRLYEKMDNRDSSVCCFNQGLQMSYVVGNYHNVGQISLLKANQALKAGDTVHYLENIMDVINLGKLHNLYAIEGEAYTTIEEYYKQKKEWDSAYKYSKQAYLLERQYNHEQQKKHFVAMEEMFAFEQQQILQQSENEKDKTKMLLSILFASVVLIFSFITVYRSFRKQHLATQKMGVLSQDLENRDKELTGNITSLMKTNEIMVELTKRLNQILETTREKNTRESARRIISYIKMSSKGKAMDEFELNFKQIHKNFYNKLLEDYSGLTPNELRLCALLKLSLSTKEISGITGQSIRAIEMGRFRLRKKLGIDVKSTNINQFLEKY